MLELLQLLQLADSALPIGASAHSFGLETLSAEGELTPTTLARFFADLLQETAPLEAAGCRSAYELADAQLFNATTFYAQWVRLNQTLSARKPARESREASATLGKRFLRLAASLEPLPRLQHAVRIADTLNVGTHKVDLHLCTAFGLVGGCLGLGTEAVTLAYLQQNLTGLLSACQRLMPVGQNQVMALSWQLKPLLVQIATRSQSTDLDSIPSFAPLLELAGMRHASLPVRLFIS
ncbi:MAG: hypothetical protein KDE54_30555 [Caldilineaceae bacterium]|nr:hypothetical protein [Caldilineaceae bacterium]MCB0144753.1 hypothetical protein [Caldilineaceae bacterium]